MKTIHKTLLIAGSCSALFLSSCQTYTQEGALVGGLGGAALGAIIADDAAAGALIGGAAGAAAGAAIGSGKDRRYGYYNHDRYGHDYGHDYGHRRGYGYDDYHHHDRGRRYY